MATDRVADQFDRTARTREWVVWSRRSPTRRLHGPNSAAWSSSRTPSRQLTNPNGPDKGRGFLSITALPSNNRMGGGVGGWQLRRPGYGVERPSVHPLRFTTSPWFWIKFSILSAGFPTAAARRRGPAPPGQ